MGLRDAGIVEQELDCYERQGEQRDIDPVGARPSDLILHRRIRFRGRGETWLGVVPGVGYCQSPRLDGREGLSAAIALGDPAGRSPAPTS